MKKCIETQIIQKIINSNISGESFKAYFSLFNKTDSYGFTYKIDFANDKNYNEFIRPDLLKELINKDLIILFKSNIVCIKDYLCMNKLFTDSKSFNKKEYEMTYLDKNKRYNIKKEFLSQIEFLDYYNEFELLEIPTEEEIISENQNKFLNSLNKDEIVFK